MRQWWSPHLAGRPWVPSPAPRDRQQSQENLGEVVRPRALPPEWIVAAVEVLLARGRDLQGVPGPASWRPEQRIELGAGGWQAGQRFVRSKVTLGEQSGLSRQVAQGPVSTVARFYWAVLVPPTLFP